MAPLSTTPAPFRITGKLASESSTAAASMAARPPGERSRRTICGRSISITWVQ